MQPKRYLPNPLIGIDPRYFSAAVKDYYGWRVKWWREAVQNAFDAGATEIRLSSRTLEDGTVEVVCEDNGRGMTPTILRDKFLMLGGSTKDNDDGSAGGFGKAKELLLLPWIAWEVHVDGLIAMGGGLAYDERPGPARKGTKLVVRMQADLYTTTAYAGSFLEKSDLGDRKVFVDGELWKNWMRPTKVLREVPDKARIYVVEHPDRIGSGLVVRTKGLFMFEEWMDGEVRAHIVVELIGPSVELLTANRDGFREPSLRSAVKQFSDEIAKDTKSALRNKLGLVRKVYRGTGRFVAKNDKEQMVEDATLRLSKKGQEQQALEEIAIWIDEIGIKSAKPGTTGFQVKDDGQPDGRPLLLPTSQTAREVVGSIDYKGRDHIEAALKQLVWEPDFYLVNDIEGFKVPANFTPEKMGVRNVRLLKIWVELCRYVLMQLGQFYEFGVGFLFSENALAECRKEEGESWLMLNPYRDKQRTKTFAPSDTDDLGRLYAFAMHEVTHLAYGNFYHDEEFAAAFTEVVAKCAPGWRQIRAIERSIKLPKSADKG